jgi:hypothetical protein
LRKSASAARGSSIFRSSRVEVVLATRLQHLVDDRPDHATLLEAVVLQGGPIQLVHGDQRPLLFDAPGVAEINAA